jgi:hypothetical protein
VCLLFVPGALAPEVHAAMHPRINKLEKQLKPRDQGRELRGEYMRLPVGSRKIIRMFCG